MLTTTPMLLTQPLMIDAAHLPHLIDDAIRTMLGSAGSVPKMMDNAQEPTVEVAYYDADLNQLEPELTMGVDGEQRRAQEIETEGREANSLIVVVPLSGVLTRHGYIGWWSSAPGTAQIGRMLQKLDADPAIHSIVLHIDSPGGSAAGTPELAEIIYNIREGKRTEIVSAIDPLMASAATYTGTAASRVFSIASGYSGSIGTVISYTNYAKQLAEAGIEVEYFRTPAKKNRFTGVEPLDEDMRKTLEQRIEEGQAWFVRDMARNRKVSEGYVNKHFGMGEVMRADEAVEAKLIDGIMSIDDVVAEQGAKIKRHRATTSRTRAGQRLEQAVAETDTLSDDLLPEESETSEEELEPAKNSA